MKKLCFLLIPLIVLSCTNTTRNTLKFTKQNYIGKWPFSVDEIEVYCSGYSEVYCTASNGKTYALNGTAKGASHDNPRISKVEEIWLNDPEREGLKIPYVDFITEGLLLCENK
nr:DUF2511 domain-containing protein [uncultured Chryseobacterium sp.]